MLPAKISKNTVLNAARSPYLVEGALVVLPGARLTVQAGTVIWFRKLGLIVKGELQINGSEAQPVRFASLGSNNWKGIFFDKSQTVNQLQYCQISNAEFGIRSSGSTVRLQNCIFQDNVWGIVIEEGKAEIHNSLVRTSDKIGIAARKAHLLVKDSVITENGSGGFILEKSKAQIEQNNILNNGNWAIKAISSANGVKAANNWWGVDDPEQTEIIGKMTIQPILKKPINFKIAK